MEWGLRGGDGLTVGKAWSPHNLNDRLIASDSTNSPRSRSLPTYTISSMAKPGRLEP
jgi:hypothetical protein